VCAEKGGNWCGKKCLLQHKLREDWVKNYVIGLRVNRSKKVIKGEKVRWQCFQNFHYWIPYRKHGGATGETKERKVGR